MPTDIYRIEYKRTTDKGIPEEIGFGDLAEELLELFPIDNEYNVFYLPERKKAITTIKDAEFEDKKMEKALLAFVKNNKTRCEYRVIW